MRYRLTRSFLRGCIVGCLATFFLYILLRFAEQDVSGRTGSTACVQTVTFNADREARSSSITIENQLIGSSDDNNVGHSRYSIGETLMSLLHLVGSVISLGEEYYSTSKVSSEFQTKKPLLVIVTTTQKQLQSTTALVSTTLHHPSVDYKILVGGKLDPSLLEYMQATADNVYHVPQCNEFMYRLDSDSMGCLLNTINSRYGGGYQWFVVASSQTYIAGGELHQLLAQLDPSDIVYMGHPSNSVAKKQNRHEDYCEEGPGIILSNAALKSIQPYLQQCMYGRGQGDVALGKCFNRNLHTQCTKTAQSLKLFVNDKEGLSLHPDKLWYDHTLQDFLTLYPIRSPAHMFSVDLYCKHREANRLHRHARYLDKHANLVCQHVPNRLKPPLSELNARLCEMNGDVTFNYTTIDTSTMNITSDDIPNRFYPKNMYEVPAWKTLDGMSGYSLGSEVPMTRISGEFRQEMDYVIKKATQYVQDHELEELSFHSLRNGYVRYSGLQGREFILDIQLQNSRREGINRRVHLVRPHLPSVVAMGDTSPSVLTRQVNFIVPLSHVTERFTEFLKTYEGLCLIPQENCNLVLSVYGDQEYKNVQTRVQEYAKQHPGFHYNILKGSGLFTRARALNLGLSHLKDADLAFLCDVDMTIKPGFLNRCRQNTLRNSRVYYPTFFKYYDMDYVYKFKKKPLTFPIAREHGHWASYSYGMVCIYKSDYDAIGGFDTAIEGWGEEDVDLFRKVINHRLDVMRTADHGLFHRYHDKICSAKLNPTQFKHCISSREEDIADRMQLAEYVFYLEDKHNIRKRKLWS